MMRSWGNRRDTFVVDEPFYAFYLKATGKKHPGADEIIEKGQTDWRKVVQQLTGPIPMDKRVFFQKQMTHHLLPEIDRAWVLQLTNCFLIRNPREVILSYIKKNPEPRIEDLGFIQQYEIFEFVRQRTGSVPPIIDAKDLLENPEQTLRRLCHVIGVEFDPAMLSWPPGPHETDGIWAKSLVPRRRQIDLVPALPPARRRGAKLTRKNLRARPRMLPRPLPTSVALTS